MTEPYINRKNLTKLAKYLEGLPRDYEFFEMVDYISNKFSNEKHLDYALNNGGVDKCGTGGCAIGHGPAAGILFKEEDLTPNALYAGGFEVDWNKYCETYFVTTNSAEWEWMFSGDWTDIDNTPQGAAARIRYFLKHGVPEDEIECHVRAPYNDETEEVIWFTNHFDDTSPLIYADYLKKGS